MLRYGSGFVLRCYPWIDREGNAPFLEANITLFYGGNTGVGKSNKKTAVVYAAFLWFICW